MIRMLPVCIIAFWLVCLLPWFLINPGSDGGLDTPQNAIAWIVIAVVILLAWFCFAPGSIGSRSSYLSASQKLFFAGCAVLFLPLLWAPALYRDLSFTRLGGLAGGCLFFLSLLRLPLTVRHQGIILTALLTAAVVQAVTALLQWYIPALNIYPWSQGRLSGVFQQPALLGSFLATGYALCWLLYTRPEYCPTGPGRTWLSALLGSAFFLLPFTLTCIQSRTGWLGGLTVLLLMLLTCAGHESRRTLRAFLLSAAGVLAAIVQIMMVPSPGLLSHEASDNARSTIMRLTLNMVAGKPWSGWGYGSFEHEFSLFRLREPFIDGITRHPNNEFLLWVAEGGVAGALGMFLIAAGAITLLPRARRKSVRDKQAPSPALLLCIALSPLVIHALTGYPFYQSVPHWMVFLLLLAFTELTVHPTGLVDSDMVRRTTTSSLSGISISLSALVLIVLMSGCLYGGIVLTKTEATGLTNVQPLRTLPFIARWPFHERIEYDLQTHALLTFNDTRDERLLDEWLLWAEGYQSRHVDDDVLASEMAILAHQKKYQEAEFVRQRAHRLFVQDVRFFPPASGQRKGTFQDNPQQLSKE